MFALAYTLIKGAAVEVKAGSREGDTQVTEVQKYISPSF